MQPTHDAPSPVVVVGNVLVYPDGVWHMRPPQRISRGWLFKAQGVTNCGLDTSTCMLLKTIAANRQAVNCKQDDHH